MKRQATEPTGIAQNFAINETFFSTTDERGIITSGNSVFSRTSEYALEELVGSPHNLIRHPDMPRCVFALLWAEVKKRRPFAGYVKNHAKNGNHYWVFALIEADGQELLSTRIKPSCDTLETIEALYAQLLLIEESALEQGLTPAAAINASLAELQKSLEALGFDSYRRFSQQCTILETKSRDQIAASRALPLFPPHLSVEADAPYQATFQNSILAYQTLGKSFSSLDRFLSMGTDISKSRDELAESADHFRHYALNTNIAASSLGGSGATIGTITEFLHTQADSFGREARRMSEIAEGTNRAVVDMVAHIASARIKLEMLLCFTEERAKNDDPKAEARLAGMNRSLEKAVRSSLSGTQSAIDILRQTLPKLRQSKEDLLKSITFFSTAQTNGLIECSRIREAHELDSLFLDFGERIERAKTQLLESYEIAGQLAGLAKTITALIAQAQIHLEDQARRS